MPRDLEGLLVVSLEQAVAAPYVSSRLADAGARVIKLERREGDFARRYDSHVHGDSSYFVWLNRGKESVFIDLKDPADLGLLDRLVSQADVFIQNLAPGALERTGQGSAALRAKYPSLITCDISGYGSSGPYRDMKAYDLLVQAESGLAMLTGTESEPGRVGVSVCDIACGMNAHQAILQALYGRMRTGKGRGIEVSLFDSMADWMNVPYLQYKYGAHAPARLGLKHPTIAPYGVFHTQDGKNLLISIQNEREWLQFCADILGDATLASDSRFATNILRVQNRTTLDAVIAVAFGARTRDQLIADLTTAGIAFGQLSTLEDFANHPQLRFVRVETATGAVDLIAPPAITLRDDQHLGSVPTAGQHDQAVRAEFAAS